MISMIWFLIITKMCCKWKIILLGMVRLQIFKTLKNKKNRKEMLMFCEFIKQELTVTNIDTLLYYTEEKEHASTSCFGMWGAQRHITAATRCAPPFGAVLGTRGAVKGRRFRAASANWLRLRSANFVLPRRYLQ